MLPEKEILEILALLEGQAAVYLEDLDSGDLFTVNADRVFPSASTIKIPLLSALLKGVEAGSYDLDAEITVAPENRVGGCGVISELHPGLRPTIRDLATLMIIQSDNAATNQIIDLVSMGKANVMARELGLTGTVLQRKMMDFEAAKAGKNNFTSARDLGRLLKMLHRGEVVNPSASRTIIETMKRQQLNNKLPLYLPADVVIAHKTGDLNLLEHDAGIFYLPGKTYVLVVLTDHLSTNKSGVEAIGKISLAVYHAMTA